MATKLFVGNLPFSATENDLQDYFATAGTVIAVNIMQDRAADVHALGLPLSRWGLNQKRTRRSPNSTEKNFKAAL